MALVAKRRTWALACTSLFALGLCGPAIVHVLSCERALAGPPSVPSDHARRRSQNLDTLFGSLKAARDQAAADRLVSDIWAEWMRSGRDDVDIMMSRAVASMAGRHYGLALMLLDAIVDLVPDFAEGWNKRATLHYSMGHHDRSLADIEKVLALEPRHFGALAGRAAIHADAERWKEALQAYRAALQFNPFLHGRDKVLRILQERAGERGI